MGELAESYTNLKKIIINAPTGNRSFDINTLIDQFRSQINSVRTCSQINDLSSLMTVLEKRDVLDPENVGSMEFIFNALNLSVDTLHKHKLLIDGRAKNVNRPLTENTHSDHVPYRQFNHSSGAPPSPSRPTTQTATRQSKLPDEVVSAVASQIGYSWKGLARYLGHVKEGTLEKIEEDQSITTNEMRARLMLAEYETEVDPSELCSRLLRALELSKRKDLHEKVVKILLREART